MSAVVLAILAVQTSAVADTHRKADAAVADPDEDADDDDEARTDWHEGTQSRPEAKQEAWSGTEAFRHVVSLYGGATYAPFGNLRQDGVRLRVVSSFAAYRYGGRRFNAATGDAVRVGFNGLASNTEALIGYQWSAGGLTAKIFGGYQFGNVVIAPYDPETTVQGRGVGAKGGLELWYNVTPALWTSLDLSYGQLHRAQSHRLRAAHRVGEHWSIGAEIGSFSHVEGRTWRAGGMIRFDNGLHELSGSVGWNRPEGDRGGSYATMQWLRRF